MAEKALGIRTRGLLLLAAAIEFSSGAKAGTEAADRELAAVLHAHNQGGPAAKAATITMLSWPAAPSAKVKTSAGQPIIMAAGPAGIYEATSAGRFSPEVQGALDRV